jgi:hypothetical protein
MSDSESDGYASPDRYWDEKHSIQLEELYRSFKSCGEVLFGTAFHQLGNLSTFIKYVESTTLLCA